MVESARLYCLRHGESANVAAGAAGVLPSAPLTARGREQALAAAAALHHEPVAGVYASVARRSQQTGEIIAAAQGVRPTIMADLDEVGIGALEGATDPATRARRCRTPCRSWSYEHRTAGAARHGRLVGRQPGSAKRSRGRLG